MLSTYDHKSDALRERRTPAHEKDDDAVDQPQRDPRELARLQRAQFAQPGQKDTEDKSQQEDPQAQNPQDEQADLQPEHEDDDVDAQTGDKIEPASQKEAVCVQTDMPTALSVDGNLLPPTERKDTQKTALDLDQNNGQRLLGEVTGQNPDAKDKLDADKNPGEPVDITAEDPQKETEDPQKDGEEDSELLCEDPELMDPEQVVEEAIEGEETPEEDVEAQKEGVEGEELTDENGQPIDAQMEDGTGANAKGDGTGQQDPNAQVNQGQTTQDPQKTAGESQNMGQGLQQVAQTMMQGLEAMTSALGAVGLAAGPMGIAGPLASGLSAVGAMGVSQLAQNSGLGGAIDAVTRAIDLDMTPEAPQRQVSKAPPYAPVERTAAPTGEPRVAPVQAEVQGGGVPDQTMAEGESVTDETEQSVPAGTPIEANFEGQWTPDPSVVDFETQAPVLENAPVTPTVTPAVDAGQALMDANADALTRQPTEVNRRAASELHGQGDGAIPGDETCIDVEGAQGLVTGQQTVQEKIDGASNDQTPAGTAPLAGQVNGGGGNGQTTRNNAARSLQPSTVQNPEPEDPTAIQADAATAQEGDAKGTPRGQMPTLGDVDVATPAYPGGSERLPSVRRYAPTTPDLSNDTQAFSRTLDNEASAQDSLVTDAQAELNTTLDAACDEGHQQLEEISREPLRNAQTTVEQGHTQVQGESDAHTQRAQGEMEQIISDAVTDAQTTLQEGVQDPLPGGLVGGEPGIVGSAVMSDQEAYIQTMMPGTPIEFATPGVVQGTLDGAPVALQEVTQSRDAGLERFGALENAAQLPEPDFDPRQNHFEDMVDCDELDPSMTSLQDVDLSPPASMNFPRGGGDPMGGPAAINEIQAQVVEQASAQMPTVRDTWEADAGERMRGLHTDRMGEIQGEFDSAHTEASALMDNYETAVPDLDPAAQLAEADQLWGEAQTEAGQHITTMQTDMQTAHTDFMAECDEEGATFTQDQQQAADEHRTAIQGHQTQYQTDYGQARQGFEQAHGQALGDLQSRQQMAHQDAQRSYGVEQQAYGDAVTQHEQDFDRLTQEATQTYQHAYDGTRAQVDAEVARMRSEADAEISQRSAAVSQEVEQLRGAGQAEVDGMLRQGQQEYQAEIDAGVAQAEAERTRAEREADEARNDEKGFFERIGDAISSVFDWIADLFAEVRDTICNFLERAKQAALAKLRQWRQKALDKLTQLRDGISNVIARGAAWMRSKVAAVGQSIRSAIQQGAELLNRAASGLATIVNAHLEGFRQGVNLVAEGFFSAVTLINEDLGQEMREAGEGYLQSFNQAVQQAQSDVDAASASFQTAVTAQSEALQARVTQAEQAMVARIDAAEQNLQQGVDNLYEGAVDAVNTTFDAAEDAVETVFDATQTAVRDFFDARIGELRAASEAVREVASWAQQQFDDFVEWAGEAWEAVKEALSEAWLAIEEAFVSFWNSPWRDVIFAVGLTALAIVVTVATAGAGAPLLVAALAAGAAAGTAAAATYGVGELAARRANVDLMQHGRTDHIPGRTMQDPVTGAVVPDPTDPANEWYTDTMGNIRRHPNGGLSYQDPASGEWIDVDPTDPNAATILATNGFTRGEDGTLSGESFEESMGGAGRLAAQKGAEHFIQGFVVGLTAGPGGGMLANMSSNTGRIAALGGTYYVQGNVTQTVSSGMDYMMNDGMGFGEAMGEVWDDRTHEREAITRTDENGQEVVVGYGRGAELTTGQLLLREGGALAGNMIMGAAGAAGRRPLTGKGLPDNLFNMTMRDRMVALGLDTAAGMTGDAAAYGIDLATGREQWQGWNHFGDRMLQSGFSNSAGGITSAYAQRSAQRGVVNRALGDNPQMQQEFAQMNGRSQEALYEIYSLPDGHTNFRRMVEDPQLRQDYLDLPTEAQYQFQHELREGLPSGQYQQRLQELAAEGTAPRTTEGDAPTTDAGTRQTTDGDGLPNVDTPTNARPAAADGDGAPTTRTVDPDADQGTLVGGATDRSQGDGSGSFRDDNVQNFATGRLKEARRRLSRGERQEFDQMLAGADNTTARSMMERALAAGNSMDNVRQMRDFMSGKSPQEILSQFTGQGIFQFFGHSCVPTAYQIARAEVDPYYAYKLQTDPVFAMREQQIALEAAGGASLARRGSGNEVLEQAMRDNPELAAFYQDQSNFNNQGTHGIEPNLLHQTAGGPADGLQQATGRQYTVHNNDALPWKHGEGAQNFNENHLPMHRIDAALDAGLPVPFSTSNPMLGGHEMVIIGSFMRGGKRQYIVHDPASGSTSAMTSDLMFMSGVFRPTTISLPQLTVRERMSLNFIRGALGEQFQSVRQRLTGGNTRQLESDNASDAGTLTPRDNENSSLNDVRPPTQSRENNDPNVPEGMDFGYSTRSDLPEMATSNGQITKGRDGIWRDAIGRPVHEQAVRDAYYMRRETAITESRKIYQERDAQVASQIDRMVASGEPIVVESLGIGSGWASVANANTHPLLRQTGDNGLPSHLTIALGDDPWLQRNEAMGQFAQDLQVPGLTRQPADFALDGDYTPARAFAAAVAQTRADSGMATYNARITGIDDAPAGSPGRYKVTVRNGDQEFVIFTNNVDVGAGPGPARLLSDVRNMDPVQERQLIDENVLFYGDKFFHTGISPDERVLIYGGGATSAWNAESANRAQGNVEWYARASSKTAARLNEIETALRRPDITAEETFNLKSERRRLMDEPFAGSNVDRNASTLENPNITRAPREIERVVPIVGEDGKTRAQVFFKGDDEPQIYDRVVVSIGQDPNKGGGPANLIRNVDGPLRAIIQDGQVIGLENGGVRILGAAAAMMLKNLSPEDQAAFQLSLQESARTVSANTVGPDGTVIPVGIEVWATTLAKLNAMRGGNADANTTGSANLVGGRRSPQQARSEVFAEIEFAAQMLRANSRVRGEFEHRVLELQERWRQASDLLGDPEMLPMLQEEFMEIRQQSQRLQREIQERSGNGSSTKVPDYIQQDRPPQDNETFLSEGGFQRTSMRFQGRTVYRDRRGRYYHVDNFHTGEGAEIEYYNAQGKHLGTLNPDGSPKHGAVPGRVLPGA